MTTSDEAASTIAALRHKVVTRSLSAFGVKVLAQIRSSFALGKLDRQEKLGPAPRASMSGTGFAYLHPWTYEAVMRVLHRGSFGRRYEAVARYVPANASVIDLCCGDARLADYLPQGASYTGLDANERFVRHARTHRRDVRVWDARRGGIPHSDVVVIQSSLYQFHPDEASLIARAFAAANHRLIIAEPVVSWTSHGNRLQRLLARRMTRFAGQRFDFRHNEQTLNTMIDRLGASRVSRERVGRDYILAADK